MSAHLWLVGVQHMKSRAHFWVFGHFFLLHFGLWNGNGDGVGAGKSSVPGSYRVDNLAEIRRRTVA